MERLENVFAIVEGVMHDFEAHCVNCELDFTLKLSTSYEGETPCTTLGQDLEEQIIEHLEKREGVTLGQDVIECVKETSVMLWCGEEYETRTLQEWLEA